MHSLKIKEITIFGMLGALMYASKLLMEILPNVHLLGVFIVAFTVVYRKKALFPIYTFVILTGLFSGFATWWVAYIYIWTPLWGAVMLVPKALNEKLKQIIYILLCSAHGFLYGILYSPMQAILFGLDFKGMIAWIVAGFPFDIAHGISNFLCGFLIFPIIKILKLSEKI